MLCICDKKGSYISDCSKSHCTFLTKGNDFENAAATSIGLQNNINVQ